MAVNHISDLLCTLFILPATMLTRFRYSSHACLWLNKLCYVV